MYKFCAGHLHLGSQARVLLLFLRTRPNQIEQVSSFEIVPHAHKTGGPSSYVIISLGFAKVMTRSSSSVTVSQAEPPRGWKEQLNLKSHDVSQSTLSTYFHHLCLGSSCAIGCVIILVFRSLVPFRLIGQQSKI